MTNQKIIYPDNKKFAFTIFDDTDLSKTGNYELIYDFLADLGFRTTKSVWPLSGKHQAIIEGATLETDQYYVDYHKKLQKLGFEIGYHCSSYTSHHRDDILRGMETFKNTFGAYPKTMSNHADSKEALYWGPKRIGGLNRLIYNFATKFRHQKSFFGDDSTTPFFWGDFCKSNIKYVRNFITDDLNTLKAYPQMPYYDSTKPQVPFWFASSEGPEVHSFNHTIREEAQEQLVSEGGAAIMYTHFACGFIENGKLNPKFKNLMESMANKNGYFVPVGTLLDYLIAQKGAYSLSIFERQMMEAKWILHKIRIGGTS